MKTGLRPQKDQETWKEQGKQGRRRRGVKQARQQSAAPSDAEKVTGHKQGVRGQETVSGSVAGTRGGQAGRGKKIPRFSKREVTLACESV